jgi:hypothetical protein
VIELPYINPNLYLDRNVAVIGSSGALLGSGLGKTIDTFKEVVRFNRAPTNGFENDVGSKTTLRVVNNHVFDNKDITKAGFSNSPANFVRDLRNCKILYVGPDICPWNRRYENSHPSNELFLFDYRSIYDVKKVIGCTFEQNLLIGTTFIALCISASIKITLFGFDLEPLPRTHYWQDRPKVASNIYHNPFEESKIIKKMITNKQIHNGSVY